MSATAQQIIERVGELAMDVRHHKFSTAVKLKEINTIIKSKFAGLMRPYSRETSVNLKHDVANYDYPDDFLHNVGMEFTGYKGTSEVLVYDRDQYTHKMVYHNNTSNNQFRLDPVPDVEKYADSTTWYTDDIPSAATVGETWLDRDGYILYCDTTYSAAAAELIVISRPDTNLVFNAVADGTSFINVAFTRGGESNPASKAVTGSGTYDDPYLYTFTLYDDNNSNDDIITLLSGDAILTASGASSTNESTVTELGSTPLVNEGEANWQNFRIDIDYKAGVPLLYNLTDELHPCIKAPLDDGDAIAHFAAANLIKRSKRPDYNKVQVFRNDAQEMMFTAQSLVSRNKRRRSLRMTPGY